MSVNGDKIKAIIQKIWSKLPNPPPMSGDDIVNKIDEVYEAGKLNKFEEFKTKISEYIDVPDDITPDDMVDLLFEKYAVNRTGSGRNFFSSSQYKKFPPIDTSGMTEMQNFLAYTTAEEVELDLSSITNGYQFLTRAPNLKKVTLRNMSKKGSSCSLNSMFWVSGGVGYAALEELIGLNVEYATSIVDILRFQDKLVKLQMEGFIKLDFSISHCTSLSHESLINVTEHLFDYREDTSGAVHKLIMGSTNIAKLTDEELEIIGMKGWIYS